MPYSSIDELPEGVKDALSKHEQEIFLAAFNSAHEQGKSEESCFKIAWAAAKKGREDEKEAPQSDSTREAQNSVSLTSGPILPGFIVMNGTTYYSTTTADKSAAVWTPTMTDTMTYMIPSAVKTNETETTLPLDIPHTRMLNISLGDITKFQEIDGGLLVKDAIILAEGTWTDSNIKTALFYPAATLQKYAENWQSRSIWVRHAGKVPRSVTDKVGSIKNPHYNPQYRAIMGDLFFHRRTQTSKDASELVRCGEINAVSVEHGGEERWNAAMNRLDAMTLDLFGLALVDMGACEVCKIRHDERVEKPTTSDAPQVTHLEQTPQDKEQDKMDDETKKALTEISARLKALEDAFKPAEKKEEPKKEAEKPAPVPTIDIAGEIAKALEPIAQRLNALEKRPEPRSLQPKEDEKSEKSEGYKVKARTMSQNDF